MWITGVKWGQRIHHSLGRPLEDTMRWLHSPRWLGEVARNPVTTLTEETKQKPGFSQSTPVKLVEAPAFGDAHLKGAKGVKGLCAFTGLHLWALMQVPLD